MVEMKSGRVHQAPSQKPDRFPAGADQGKDPETAIGADVGGEQTHRRVAPGHDQRLLRIHGPGQLELVILRRRRRGAELPASVHSVGNARVLAPTLACQKRPRRRRGSQAQSTCWPSISPKLKSSSTEQSKARARESAAAVEGMTRRVSMALMAARERPERRASSCWDQFKRRRRWERLFRMDTDSIQF